MHGNFGFEPRNAMLVNTILDMAGYRGDAVPTMQKRMLDSIENIPGVTSAGLVSGAPLTNGDLEGAIVYTDETTDLKPANSAASAVLFKISPDYLRAAGTALLSGRQFTSHDDKDSPRVALINQEFARKVFGSVRDAVGRIYKMRGGTRVQVVGIVEDGKYESLTEDPKPAVYPYSNRPRVIRQWWCARPAIRSNSPRPSGTNCTTLMQDFLRFYKHGTTL